MNSKRPAGLVIRDLSSDDPNTLSAAFASIGWDGPASRFETYLAECRDGQRVALVAEFDSAVAGYGTVVRNSPLHDRSCISPPALVRAI